MKVVTVTLNPAVDKTLIIPNFRLERVVRVSEVLTYPSGKGINVARVLVRLGMPAICLGFVGGYVGAFLADRLSREGIDHEFTIVTEETRTNLTIRDPDTNVEVHLVEPGSRVTTEDWHRFVETYKRHLGEANLVALCGSLPPGAPTEGYAQLLRLARDRGVPCALDSSGIALRKGVEVAPKIVKPNRQELSELFGDQIDGEEKLLAAIKRLHEIGIQIIAVSLGRDGAVGSDGASLFKAIPPPVKVVNTIGSGDAFLGGLIFALLKGLPLGEALKFAVAAGTSNTLVDGPGYIDPQIVYELFEKVKLERLS